jgi:hypothetical protein
MITAFGHATLLVHDLQGGIDCYRHILAREPQNRVSADGLESAIFAMDNSTLRVSSPHGPGSQGDIARRQLAEAGDGFVDLAFRVDDVHRAHRRLKRLSLSPETISDTVECDSDGSIRYAWKRIELPAVSLHGVAILLSDLDPGLPSPGEAPSDILGFDLLVVATAHPERAAFLYGARLGLPMIFDRVNGKDSNRLMQFACADMLIEVVHRPGQDKDGRDRICRQRVLPSSRHGR